MTFTAKLLTEYNVNILMLQPAGTSLLGKNDYLYLCVQYTPCR